MVTTTIQERAAKVLLAGLICLGLIACAVTTKGPFWMLKDAPRGHGAKG